MNAVRMRLGLIVSCLFLLLAAAAARQALADVPPYEQAACRNKRPDDLCALQDGGGGVCTERPCPRGGGSCLTCTVGPVNSPEADPVGPFIAVGAVITITCAIVVILRLRKHWGDKP